MLNRKALAIEALGRALRLRKKLGIGLDESISAIEVAESLNIEVRLIDLPSMEGMYINGSTPKIVLSSLRPQGRRNFTCAHELGHHIYGHGEQFDEMTNTKSRFRKDDPKEFSADCFAAYFLMPKATIESGMKRRNFKYDTLDPQQIYALSSWLGVGYATLINHMQFGLQMIEQEKAYQLLNAEPQEIRQQIYADSASTNLHIADEHWIGRAIDCEVGDFLLLPKHIELEGGQLEIVNDVANSYLRAKLPGIARVTNKPLDWSVFIRVSPNGYKGRSCYRFEEDVDE